MNAIQNYYKVRKDIKKYQKKRQFVTRYQILFAFHRILMPEYYFSIPFGVPSAPQTFGLK
jgi:hypothetical protein